MSAHTKNNRNSSKNNIIIKTQGLDNIEYIMTNNTHTLKILGILQKKGHSKQNNKVLTT